MLSVFLALPVPHSLSVSLSFFSARPLSESVVFHAVCLSRFSVPLSFSLSLYVSLSFFCPPSLCICPSLMPSVLLAFSVPHSLSVSLSFSLPALSLNLFVSHAVCLSRFLCPSLTLCRSVRFSARPLSASVCLSCRLSFSLSLSLTHSLPVSLSFTLPALSLHLSVYHAVCLSLFLSLSDHFSWTTFVCCTTDSSRNNLNLHHTVRLKLASTVFLFRFLPPRTFVI